MSRWWQNDMSDAGQGLYADPALAVQMATAPAQLLNQQQVDNEEAVRQARGGFMQKAMGLLGSVGKSVDGALSHVPGWGVTKNTAGVLWYPVDKFATGAHWIYSHTLSQPLSTLFLMGARTDLDTASWFSGDDWSDTWHHAEKISPAQAFANYENVVEASGDSTLLSGWFGGGADNLTSAERAQVKQQTDKFLYDTDYWRNKTGWQYTVGTGALDFSLVMGADPTYAAIKTGSAALKAGRSVQVAGEAAQGTKSISGVNILAEKAGQKIGEALAKNPAEISRSKRMEDFYKWSEGKSPFEIRQHPIWGTGRRVNPAADQLSQVFAHADEVEKPLLLRFAAGDNDAAAELASKNKDLMAQVGRMSDNRQLVDSVKFDSDLFAHFMTEERAGRTAPTALAGPGVGGTSPSALGTRLVEPPYPRPTTPGPRQQGWDATYGHLAGQAGLYRAAVGDILKSGNGVRPMGGAAATSLADSLRFDQWKAGQAASLDAQLGRMQQKENFYQGLLGPGGLKGVEEFSPGESNIFGTLKSMYRMGPLAIKDTEKSADRAITAATVDRAGRKAEGGLVTRTIRQGYYTVPLRIVQSFGDRLPQTFINHNDTDAADRVLDMLKRVPGLGQEARLGMLNTYSMAPDKVTKADALRSIHTSIVKHMAEGVHKLDPMIARELDEMIETGKIKTMTELTGQAPPKSQMFSTAKGLNGVRADKVEEGEGYIVAPLAKTQLQIAEPLLDVKELDRLISRHSGYFQSVRQSGGSARDAVVSVADSFSNLWKAGTLLRPGYILRAPSEEMAASAVKFGMISRMADAGEGGYNWIRNRGQQLEAVIGKGSYTPATGNGLGSSRTLVKIGDEDVIAATKERAAALKAAGKPVTEADKVQRIRVNSAWPIVQARISDERDALTAINKAIDDLKAKPGYNPADLAALQQKAVEHQSIMDEHTDYADEILRNATDSTGRRLGEGMIEHKGIRVPEAFSKAWENPIPREQISSEAAMHTMFARGEAIDTGRLIRTGNWEAITRDQPQHMSAWLDALNKQFRQDDLFKLVASDPSLKSARAWLRTPAGKLHVSQLGRQGRDPDQLLTGVKNTLDKYLSQNPALQAKLGRGEEITEQELRSGIQKEDFPDVHGEEVKGLTSRGHADTAGHYIDQLIERGFNRMGNIPTDIMSRHPTYLRAQEARMRQLIDQELSFQKAAGKPGDAIHPDQLNAMLQKSDRMARKDISQIVYDPTRTTATQALRFVTPFMAAHIDGLERWAGLVAEKPEFVTTAAKIYNAPVAANLVTDAQGNHVDENGYADVHDADGKVIGRKFVGIQDRVIHLKTPPGTRGIVGALTGTNGKEVPVKIQALNTILPGDPWWNPGTGPVVQVAASQLAKNDPAMGDFLQWAKVLPYGPQGFMDSLTPKYMKDVWNAYNPDSDKFQQAMLAEYQRQVAEHYNGGPVPDMRVAEKNAKKFMYLKALTSWVTPAQTNATPLTGTPYQFYVDQYKQLQQIDPKTADDKFLQKYGEDYFIFTASLSKSMGIAPTVSAVNTAKEYKDLIAGDSSLAPFIVGDIYNQGKFSSSAYDWEMHNKIGGKAVREKVSVQDAVADNQRRLGWSAYGKLMNGLDSMLIRSGYTSYTQSGAENFQALKQNAQAALMQLYPAWEEDFNTTDRGALPRRIESFKILVNDKRLAEDPMRQDIPFLAMYLQARDKYKAMLNSRGGRKLSFDVGGNPIGDNADIANAWRAYQFGLVSNSTKFADVYNRYLSNDDLQ